MKNSGKGSRKAPGDLIRAIAAVLFVAAISVILGAGPALAADDSSKPDTAAGQALVARILADRAITIEVLVILVGVALAFAYGRYRHSANGRRSAHARARGSQAHARDRSGTRIAAYSTAGARTAGQPPHADDYPSWPGRPGPYALHPDHPSWPGRPDPRWVATEAALRGDGYSGWPAADSPPWHDAEPPVAAVPSALAVRVRTEAARVQPGRVQVWDAGSVELATWIISEANQQATEIRHEARDQMAASLADAKQEAAELVAKASEQATATLTAAELEAAEIRAAVTKLTADLGGVAAQITENLVSLASPATKPVTRPVVRPATEPTPEPGTRPAGKPGSRPAGKPRTGSAPKGQPRQLVAIRVAGVATAVLFLFAVICGATEIALHGFPFFVFRSTGVGETGPSGLQENQGPGQPDAPKPTPTRIDVKPSPHGTVPSGQ
jgi:hypothetical protein